MTAQTAWMANGDTDDDSTAVAAGLAAAGLAVAPFLGLPAMPTAHLSTEHTLRASVHAVRPHRAAAACDASGGSYVYGCIRDE